MLPAANGDEMQDGRLLIRKKLDIRKTQVCAWPNREIFSKRVFEVRRWGGTPCGLFSQFYQIAIQRSGMFRASGATVDWMRCFAGQQKRSGLKFKLWSYLIFLILHLSKKSFSLCYHRRLISNSIYHTLWEKKLLLLSVFWSVKMLNTQRTSTITCLF